MHFHVLYIGFYFPLKIICSSQYINGDSAFKSSKDNSSIKYNDLISQEMYFYLICLRLTYQFLCYFLICVAVILK